MPGYDQSSYVVYLSRVPMFSRCSPKQLEHVAKLATERDAQSGTAIISEGDTGSEFFVIATGGARVLRGGKAVAELKEGDYFGELSLLDPAPRDATVEASAPTNLVVMSRDSFRRALDELPDLRDALLTGLARRVHDLDRRF
jgi:CRP-like cAMP-binding protein